MKNIGEQAKAFRESKGWNTTKMAKAVGTSRQNIENLEATGNRKPHYIIDLARVMGTTVDDLLKGTAVAGAVMTPSEIPHTPATLTQNHPPALASQPKLAINNIAISPNALMLAQWLDDMPDDRKKFMAFTECMALITKRLGSDEPSEVHVQSDEAGTPSGEFLALRDNLQIERRSGTDRRAQRR